MTINNDIGVSALQNIANFDSYRVFSLISQTVQVLLAIITYV